MNDRAAPRPRRDAPAFPSRRERPARRHRIVAALRSPDELRTAFLLREILDPPVALRDRAGKKANFTSR